MRLQETIKYGFQLAQELLFPERCISCLGCSVWFCKHCSTEAGMQHTIGICSFCNEVRSNQLTLGSLCANCRKLLNVSTFLSFYTLEHVGFRRTIHAAKYKGVVSILRIVSQYIVHSLLATSYIARPSFLSEIARERVILVPVPLHKRKERMRGYNQSLVFAQELGKLLQFTIETNIVRKIKHTPTLTRLSREERFEVIEKTYQLIKKPHPGTRYVLIDDVATSGATIATVAQLLKDNGARWVDALTIARGE